MSYMGLASNIYFPVRVDDGLEKNLRSRFRCQLGGNLKTQGKIVIILGNKTHPDSFQPRLILLDRLPDGPLDLPHRFGGEMT